MSAAEVRNRFSQQYHEEPRWVLSSTSDGEQMDHQGNAGKERRSKLYTVASYIIVTEFCERLAYFGLAGKVISPVLASAAVKNITITTQQQHGKPPCIYLLRCYCCCCCNALYRVVRASTSFIFQLSSSSSTALPYSSSIIHPIFYFESSASPTSEEPQRKEDRCQKGWSASGRPRPRASETVPSSSWCRVSASSSRSNPSLL